MEHEKHSTHKEIEHPKREANSETKHEHKTHEHKTHAHAEHAHAVHKHHKPRKIWHKKEHKKPVFTIFAILVALALLYGILSAGESTRKPTTPTNYPSFGDKYGTVNMEMYVMSQCPYGTQVEDAIQPVLQKLGDSVDFNLEFIGDVMTESEYIAVSPQIKQRAFRRADGNYYNSLHGQPEVEGDIVQLCARKYTNKLDVMDLVVCMNKNAQAIPGNWQACAEELSMDVEKIKACYEGSEGGQLYEESVTKATEAGAQGSPTLFVNGQPYQSARDSVSFQKALCAALNNHPGCAGLPACSSDLDCIAEPDKNGKCENPNTENARCTYEAAVEVEVIVLNDKTCKTCDTAQINSVTKQLFKGAKFRDVDVSSDEGKSLVEEFSLTVVPAYIFDDKVDDTYMWRVNPQLQGSFLKTGEQYRLRDEATGASHFIDEEARKEHYEKIGVTFGDNRPQVDFFVMSYCPYGNQAEELLKPVFDSLGSKADFNPRYVIYSNYGTGYPAYCIDEEEKYCSMHGIQELNQGIREMCVNKYMGTAKWFDFAIAMNSACTYQNADACWQGVADKLGLDKKKITDCFEKEAIALVVHDKELGDVLGVSGSPALFFEGEAYAGQRTATHYNAALCNAFEVQPSECDSLVSSDTPAAQAAAPAGNCG